MTNELSVPERLWPARDSAINFALVGGPVPESLSCFKSWFSEDLEVWEDLHSGEAAMLFDPAIRVANGVLSR